jgi:hypothetical protein
VADFLALNGPFCVQLLVVVGQKLCVTSSIFGLLFFHELSAKRNRHERCVSNNFWSAFKTELSAQHGPDVSIDQTWAELSKNIREIQNHNASNLSFEENHRFAYNMVLYKHGEMLYNGVNRLVAEHLDRLAADEIIPAFPAGGSMDPTNQSQEGELLLKALKNVWDDHTGSMTKLGQILKYMVRFL